MTVNAGEAHHVGLLVAAFFAASTAAAQPPAGTARQDAVGPMLVLPLVNLTGDPAEGWIAAGIAAGAPRPQG